MTMARLLFIILVVATSSLRSQSLIGGAWDYALGNSSLSWFSSPSSIFVNPSELGRIHQNEVLISTARFRSLASMSGALFVPYTGTFGFGSSVDGTETEFRAGFGRIIGRSHTVGGSLSVVDKVRGGFRLGIGSALHFPSTTENSGLHAGVAVSRLPKLPIFAGGIAYWAIPDKFRLQAAGRSRTKRAVYLGGDFSVTSTIALQMGTQAFRTMSAGVAVSTSLVRAELAAGRSGVALSLNFLVGDASAASRSEHYDAGVEAFTEGEYSDARKNFLTAVEYDEYDDESRTLAKESQRLLDSSVVALLAQAKTNEERRNFLAAMRTYAQIFRIAPDRVETAGELKDVESRLSSYIQNLIDTGDSLRRRKENDRAQRSYELAFELDPSNDTASARLDDMKNLSRENVNAILTRARSFLSHNQLDEAQADYERVLAIEPNNSRARAGLNTIQKGRLSAALEEAKALYDDGKYSEALPILVDIVQKNESNSEARRYLEQTRKVLEPEVEKIFKAGLQFYVKEDYRKAIEMWDMGLLIQPHNADTLEYRKRAEEKLKALEQLR
jgi:tetratricopeptide (TPR) repeat protein